MWPNRQLFQTDSRVHYVRWRTPLGPSISPYVSRIAALRGLAYSRLQGALNLVRIRPAKRVLDVGCWDGHFLPSLLKSFEEVWGVDDDSASVVEALPNCSTILQIALTLCETEMGSLPRLGLAKATGTALPFPAAYFDVVFCLDTLAHVPLALRPNVLREIRRILQPHGQLIVSLPIETGPVGFARRAARILTNKQSDPNTDRYDFKPDLELLRSEFALCRPQFYPLSVLGSVNPTVLVDCGIIDAS